MNAVVGISSYFSPVDAKLKKNYDEAKTASSATELYRPPLFNLVTIRNLIFNSVL